MTELLDQFDFKESVKEKLLLVETNSKRMLRLINQLLDFRKSEHGLLKLHLSSADFVEFSKEVFLSFQNLASQKQITYHFESNADELPMEFDHNQMEIVLCNLLSNAFKYTRQGGKIDVRVRVESGLLTLAIEDTGIGMSAEESAGFLIGFIRYKMPKLPT